LIPLFGVVDSVLICLSSGFDREETDRPSFSTR
jgi:hypothetical protein